MDTRNLKGRNRINLISIVVHRTISPEEFPYMYSTSQDFRDWIILEFSHYDDLLDVP